MIDSSLESTNNNILKDMNKGITVEEYTRQYSLIVRIRHY